MILSLLLLLLFCKKKKHIIIIYTIYKTIYIKDINFWHDFFIIPVLPLKKTIKKKIKHNFHIKVGFQFFYGKKKCIFFLLNN
jgi:hypothetical protein